MAKAKKLPSGNWRVNQYIGTDENGKKKFKSFTAATKKEAEYMAAEYVMNKRNMKSGNITLKEAARTYIDSKSSILSPNTISGYENILKNHLTDLQPLKIDKITHFMVQAKFNSLAESLSPKTLRNVIGFYYSATKQYTNAFADISLPPKEKKEINIPTDTEVRAILAHCTGEKQLAFALAAYAGLRRGEILALTWQDVDLKKRKIKINKSVARDPNSNKVIKNPKSYAGFREVPILTPLYNIIQAQKRTDEQVIHIGITALTRGLARACDKAQIKHIRLHDLRHYFASVLLVTMPDKYAMELMGHATNSTLKYIYQHTMDSKKNDYTQSLENYFANKFTQ